MTKYTFIIATVLLFGAFNASAQNTEKSETKNTVKLEKKEVQLKNKTTLKPAQSKKSVSSEKRTIQKARVEKKKVEPIKKEEDK